VTAISALVCTRNRGALIVDTLASILANTHPDFELVVIDQSTNDESEIAARPLMADSRLRYVRSSASGKGRALNLGLNETRAPIVAITDDDCTVPANWLEMYLPIFAARAKVAVVFCNVEAAKHDETKGYIPACVATSDKVLSNVIDLCGSRSMGAGIAVRRSMMKKIGGFDAMLGPGGPMSDADDYDIKYRAVLMGYEVYESAAFEVLHFGFRTWGQGKEMARRNYTGIGAACSKPLKCGRIHFLVVPVFEVVRHCLWPLIWDLVRLRRPRGFTRLISIFSGFSRGIRAPVDSATLTFVDPRGSDDTVRYASAT
jgi:glycosyltransferase involved in cell wall biosynthesis